MKVYIADRKEFYDNVEKVHFGYSESTSRSQHVYSIHFNFTQNGEQVGVKVFSSEKIHYAEAYQQALIMNFVKKVDHDRCFVIPQRKIIETDENYMYFGAVWDSISLKKPKSVTLESFL